MALFTVLLFRVLNSVSLIRIRKRTFLIKRLQVWLEPLQSFPFQSPELCLIDEDSKEHFLHQEIAGYCWNLFGVLLLKVLNSLSLIRTLKRRTIEYLDNIKKKGTVDFLDTNFYTKI